MSTYYYYSGSPSYSSGTYSRSYYTDPMQLSIEYNPGAFFNAWGSKTSVSNKISYAKTGLGVTGGTTVYTDTYNPSTGATTGGTEFRMVCSYTGYYGREPYDEYSHVANPLAIYDTHIKNTHSYTYIDSATKSGNSWSTTTDSAHGKVLIGTIGNPKSIEVSDDEIITNNNINPNISDEYDLGNENKKWKSIHVGTVYADNYEGMSGGGGGGGDSSSLVYNDSKKLEAVSDGVKGYSDIYPTTSEAYDLGKAGYKWNNIYADHVYGSPIIPNGTCTTSGGSSDKIVSLSNNITSLTSGMIILVVFENGNTAYSPQLSIDGGSTYNSIYRTDDTIAGDDPSASWDDGESVLLRYDNYKWLIIGHRTTALSTVGSSITNIIPSSSNTYNLGSSSYRWNYLYARYIGSSSNSVASIYGRLNSLYGSTSGAIYFFKLYITNNSSSSITVPRGKSLADSTYFGSGKLSISSYEERVDDTSLSYGTATFSGTYYTLMRFTVSTGGGNVYVPCLRYG